MKTKVKIVIFVLVVLAVGVIFAVPYYNARTGRVRQFTVTPQPAEKLRQAAENGRRVFLEFYSPQ